MTACVSTVWTTWADRQRHRGDRRLLWPILAMEAITFGDGRRALTFGKSKINLHKARHELEPKAADPRPGSADICLIADGTLDAVVDELEGNGVRIEEGPVTRTGALGPIRSVYVRDPDRNLVEISTYS